MVSFLPDGAYDRDRTQTPYTCRICGKDSWVYNPTNPSMFRSTPTAHSSCENAIGYTNADMRRATLAGDELGALHHYGRYLRACAGNPDPDSWDLPSLQQYPHIR